MYCGDGGDLVVVMNRGGQNRSRVRSAVIAGRDDQIVAGTHGVQDERRISHCGEGGLQGHG